MSQKALKYLKFRVIHVGPWVRQQSPGVRSTEVSGVKRGQWGQKRSKGQYILNELMEVNRVTTDTRGKHISVGLTEVNWNDRGHWGQQKSMWSPSVHW